MYSIICCLSICCPPQLATITGGCVCPCKILTIALYSALSAGTMMIATSQDGYEGFSCFAGFVLNIFKSPPVSILLQNCNTVG